MPKWVVYFDGTHYTILDGTWIVYVDGAPDGYHGHGRPFLERVLNKFDVSHQLAERREACLPRLPLLPRQRVRGGSQHEE